MRIRQLGCGLRDLRKAAAVLIMGFALAAGCTKDLNEGPTFQGGVETPTARGELSLTISVPGVSSPQSYALGASQEGTVVRESLHVLMFGTDTNGEDEASFTYISRQTPDENMWGSMQTGSSGNYTQSFRVELPLKENGDSYAKYRVMIVANVPEATMKEYDTELAGSTLPQTRRMIRFEQEDGAKWDTGTTESPASYDPLPLWGESSAFSSQVASVSTIALLRAVARIDVGVNLKTKDAGTGTYDLDNINGQDMDLDGHAFEIKSVRLYNAARSGYVAPATENYDRDDRKVTAPTVDDATLYHSTNQPTYEKNGTATNMLRRQIYLPETPNHGTENDEEAFFIVVGGSYNGGAESFYRIDFYDRTKGESLNDEGHTKPSGENRYDILRNHAYVINILRVRGAGYPTAAQAASSEPINMEIEIRSWDQGDNMGNVVTDGQYRLSVSSTRLEYHQDGTAQDLEVFTDYLLTDDAKNSGWKMEVLDANDLQYLNFYDEEGKEIEVDPDKWDVQDVCEGIANRTATLRVGLDLYTEETAGDQMERTITLRFTAGRMTQDVELVQDVLSTVTLSLNPEKISFTRTPKSGQFLTARCSPAENVTLYVSWEDGGNTYKYNISNPNDPENETVKEHIPAGFTDDQYNTGRKFFEASSSGGNIFQLLPTDWDANANGGQDPTAPRTWRFTVTAKWEGGSTASKTLEVEQSNWQLTWELWSAKPDASGAEQIDTVHFTAAGGTQTPYVYTGENSTLKWYFSGREMTEGNYSGEEWLTQWREMGNATYTGDRTLTLTVPENKEITRRVMVLQANSEQEGFERETSKVIIEQTGGELVLTPEAGTGAASSFAQDAQDPTKYVLDFGVARAASYRAVNVRCNTNWWWAYTEGASNELPNDNSYYTTPLHIGPEHPYYERFFSNPDQYTTEEGKDNATTGNGDKNSTTRVWTGAFAWSAPLLPFLSTSAVSDAAMTEYVEDGGFPLAGTYYWEMTLKNTHDNLDEEGVNSTYDQERIEAAARTVRVQRTIPSLWHVNEWPVDGMDYMNITNFHNSWMNEMFEFSSNAELKWSITKDGASVENGSGTFTPQRGYETQTLEEVLRKAIEQTDVSFDQPQRTYVLTLSGKRQTAENREDEDFTVSRTYYSGYGMKVPKMTNLTRGTVITNHTCNILLDFSSSAYHSAQKVRINKQGYDTDGNAVPNEVTYVEYTLDGSKGQRYIEYTVEQNDRSDRLYVYWVSYIPYGKDDYSTMFDDGTCSSSAGDCLFIQDAVPGSNSKKVYAKTQYSLPDLNNMDALSTTGIDVTKWDYCRSQMCPLTGLEFRIALPVDYRVLSGPADTRAETYATEYKQIYNTEPNICVNFYGEWPMKCGGYKYKNHHYSTQGLYLLNDDNSKNKPAWGYDCGRSHVIPIPGVYFNGSPTGYYVNQKDEKSRTMQVLKVRNPATAKPGTPATVNQALMGTKTSQ